MIVGDSDRFVLVSQVSKDGVRIVQYDTRWRRTREFEIQLQQFENARSFGIAEGAQYFVLSVFDENNDVMCLSLRNVVAPLVERAHARFYQEKWAFSGDNQLWKHVPEWIITGSQNARRALRIADETNSVELAEVNNVRDVLHVPNSGLVLLVQSGGMTICDSSTKRVIKALQLSEGQPQPLFRFRNADELWVNDVSTMLKLETRRFDVIDAAGSEPIEGNRSDVGQIADWAFAVRNELCVLTRTEMQDVIVIDAVTMLPVARARFRDGEAPLSAVMIGRAGVVAWTEGGRFVRKRLRRVPLPTGSSVDPQ